jgi:hypothetical protein
MLSDYLTHFACLWAIEGLFQEPSASVFRKDQLWDLRFSLAYNVDFKASVV